MKKTYLDYFFDISRIPRGSGNESAIADFLLEFAEEHSLEACIEEKSGNVIIKKSATSGYEDVPSVILQGHLDMVCEKEPEIAHNFEKDPIKAVRDGNIVRAEGTTLGADNGIAIAYAMAVLADRDIAHPALEVVLTTQEETTMHGAEMVQKKNFKSKYMLNLDSEEEGKFFVSSAGWMDSFGRLDIKYVPAQNAQTCQISVSGLKGGHSGMDIHKGRGNANKILCRILAKLTDAIPTLEIADIQGGRKSTAIPRNAAALINIPADAYDEAAGMTAALEADINLEYEKTDRVSMALLKSEFAETVFSESDRDKIVNFGNLVFSGAYSKIPDMDVTQCSQNFGVFAVDEGALNIEICTRSAVDSLTCHFGEINMRLFALCGMDAKLGKFYSAWQYAPDSPLRNLAGKVYKDMTGEEPELLAIHAGLECGYFAGNLGVDIISFGPNIKDVHSPTETLEVDSADRVYEYLLALLGAFKNL